MSPGKRDRACGIGRIGEDSGPLEDAPDAWGPQHEMYALARFDVHIEYDVDGRWEFEDGPRGMTIDEALAWADERAARITVQWFGPSGGCISSAGEIPLEGAPAWEAQDLVPRRIPGWEHLDRTDDDEPISWEVIARASVMPVDEGFGAALADGLRAVTGIEVVAVKADPASRPEEEGAWVIYDDVAVHLRLQARTYDEACQRAAAACAVVAVRCAPASYQRWPAELAQAYPTGSRAAENADVEQRGYFA